MQEQQVLKIYPDLGRQTARIRTPGAGDCAEVVHEWKNRFQSKLNLPSKIHSTIQFRAVKPD
jgi:hypothetical protein